MRLAELGVRNVMRSRFRAIMTVFGVAVAILAFIMLRTVLSAWTVAAEVAAKDRIVTRHKVSFIMPMPAKYYGEVSQIEGVKETCSMNWFGAKDAAHPDEFFGTIAADADACLKVYDELLITPAEHEAWKQNRSGAIVGDALAKKLGWKVGDRVTLTGSIYPGEFPFQISAIYTATRKSVDRSTFYFHYEYMNEWAKTNMPTAADQVGWIASRVLPGKRAADVAKAIDQHFDSGDIQTLSQDERSFNTSFLGMLSAVLTALDLVSIVILLIMMLILGNTIAMGVRERTQEYGVLRAIGFLPKHLALFVLGEAATIGLLGGIVGVAISYPIVELGIGRFLEENMGAFFPFFRIPPLVMVMGLVLALLLGLLAAIIPAYQATKLNVIASLRKVG